MRGLLHHFTCNTYCMNNILKKTNSTSISKFIHDTSIQVHMCVTIRISPDPYSMIFRVCFDQPDSLFDGIQGSAIFPKDFPCFCVGCHPEFRGRYHYRFFILRSWSRSEERRVGKEDRSRCWEWS